MPSDRGKGRKAKPARGKKRRGGGRRRRSKGKQKNKPEEEGEGAGEGVAADQPPPPNGIDGLVAEIPRRDAPADQLPEFPGKQIPFVLVPDAGLAAFKEAAGKALGGLDVARVYYDRQLVANDAAFELVMRQWKLQAADRQLALFSQLVRHHWVGDNRVEPDSPIGPLLGADRLLRARIAWEFAMQPAMAAGFTTSSVGAIASYVARTDAEDATDPIRRVCAATVGVLASGARSAHLCADARVLQVLDGWVESLGSGAHTPTVDAADVAGRTLLQDHTMASLCSVVVGGMASRRTGVAGVRTDAGFHLIASLISRGGVNSGPARTAVAALANALGVRPLARRRGQTLPRVSACSLFLAHGLLEVLDAVVQGTDDVRSVRCVASAVCCILAEASKDREDQARVAEHFTEFATLTRDLCTWRESMLRRIAYHHPDSAGARIAAAAGMRLGPLVAPDKASLAAAHATLDRDAESKRPPTSDTKGGAHINTGAGVSAAAAVPSPESEERTAAARAVVAAAKAAAAEVPPPEPTPAALRFFEGSQDGMFNRHISFAFVTSLSAAPPATLERWFCHPDAVSPMMGLLASPDAAVVTNTLASLAQACSSPEVATHFCRAGVMPEVRRIMDAAQRSSELFCETMNFVSVVATREDRDVSAAMWKAGLFSSVVRNTALLLREHGFQSLQDCPDDGQGFGGVRRKTIEANNKLKAAPVVKYATSACLRMCQCHTPYDEQDVAYAVEVLARSNLSVLPYTVLLVWAVAWDDRNRAFVGELGAVLHIGAWASFLYQIVDRPAFNNKVSPAQSMANLFSKRKGGSGGKSRLLLAAASANKGPGKSLRSSKLLGRRRVQQVDVPALDPDTANRTHQLTLGAIWLLTYHPDNVVRLLDTGLVSMLAVTHIRRYSDPNENPMVRVAVVEEGFVDHLFRLASNKNIPLRTRMVAGDFLQDLVRQAPENDHVRAEATAQLIDASGAQYPLMKLMLQFAVGRDALSKRYGVAMLARTVDTQRAKRYFAQIGATKTLLEELRSCARIEHTCDLLHCLLNVSSAAECQDQAGRYGMNLLLSLARNHKNSLVRDLAGRIMFNLGKHVANRTRLYKAELRHKAREARRDMVEAGAGRWVMVWDDGSLGDAKAGAVDETAADDGAGAKAANPAAGKWVMKWESAANGPIDKSLVRTEIAERRRQRHGGSPALGASRVSSLAGTSSSTAIPMSPIRSMRTTSLYNPNQSHLQGASVRDDPIPPVNATLVQRMRASTASIWSGDMKPVTLVTSAAEYELDHITASGLWKSSKSPAKLRHSTTAPTTLHGRSHHRTCASDPAPDRRARYSSDAKQLLQSKRRGSVVERAYATDLKVLEEVQPPRTRQDPWLPPIARYNTPGMARRRSLAFDPEAATGADLSRIKRTGRPTSSAGHHNASMRSVTDNAVRPLDVDRDLPTWHEDRAGGGMEGSPDSRPSTPLAVVLAPSTDRHKISLRRRLAEREAPRASSPGDDAESVSSPRSPVRRGHPTPLRRMLSHPAVSVLKTSHDEQATAQTISTPALVPKAVAAAGVTTKGWYGRTGVNYDHTAAGDGGSAGVTGGTGAGGVGGGVDARRRLTTAGGGSSGGTNSSAAKNAGSDAKQGTAGTGGRGVGGGSATAGVGPGGAASGMAATTAPGGGARRRPGALAELKPLTVQQRVAHESDTAVKLFSFDHVDGCMVCEGMFEHFITPDGQRKHYFAYDPLQHLVQDPVLVAPPPPIGLRRIFQSKYPNPPKPSPVERRPIPTPFNPTPPAMVCPTEHALPTPEHDCDMRSCPMAAKLPDRAIPFDVQRVIVVESSSSEEEVEAKFEWDISKSVFGPRARTSESRSYFDHGTQAEKRAFEVDWRRINEKSRVQRLFVRESGGDEEAWKLVKKLLWKHFPLLYDVFDYYATIGDGDAFSIQMNAWGDFTMQVGLVDVAPDCKAKDLQTIFIAANVEEDKNSAESKVNFARALHRFEFLECIIRVGLAAYHEEKTTENMVDAIEKVIVTHIVSRFDKNSQEAHNCDDFRREKLYTEGVDLMLRPRITFLRALFDAFVGIKKGTSSIATEMLLARWVDMLDKLHLMDDDFSRREAVLCFTWSKMLVIDELLHRDKFITLEFFDFVEALARAACWNSVPTDEDLAEKRVPDAFAFYVKQEAEETDPVRRPSAQWGAPSERPLEEKLAKYLDLVVGRATAGGFMRNGLAAMHDAVSTYVYPPRQSYCTLTNEAEVEASRVAVAAKAARRRKREEDAKAASDGEEDLYVEVVHTR